MTEKLDLMGLTHEAMESAYGKLTAWREDQERNPPQRPAVPLPDNPDDLLAKGPMDKRERLNQYRMLRADPRAMAASIAGELANLKLPPHAPYPKALLKDLVEMEKLYQEAETERAKRAPQGAGLAVPEGY